MQPTPHDPIVLARPDPFGSSGRAKRSASCRLRLVPALTGAARQEVETLIRQRFAEKHHARVVHFMPCLLGLRGADGALLGAVGWRSAQEQPLFLERYLDVPIEQAIAARTGRTVARHEIVEVGNLAADGVGASRLLIMALTGLLLEHGFRWVAFTAIPTLVNSFHRLDLMPQSLGLADPARMGDELPDWGNYYDNKPEVMVGEIPLGYQQLLQSSSVPRVGESFPMLTPEPVHVACR